MSRTLKRLGAATLGAALCAASPLMANTKDSDVYLAVDRDDQKAFVIFVFSDSSSSGYQPLDSAAFYPRLDYVPADGQWKAGEACAITLDYPADVPGEFKSTPIYGPNSAQTSINFADIPSYMAREAVRALLAKGYVASENAATPYFNCAGYLWARLMNQPEGAFEEIIRQEAERLRQGQ